MESQKLSTTSSQDNRPGSNYYANRNEPDPFPKRSLIDISDSSQEADINIALEAILQDALDHGFPTAHYANLRQIVLARRNVFCTTFSAGPPANVPPLRVSLKPNTMLTTVRLRRYSTDQKVFLRKLMSKLLECN